MDKLKALLTLMLVSGYAQAYAKKSLKAILCICLTGLICSPVSAYTPVKFMGGGTFDCMDSTDKCAEDGYFYAMKTGTDKGKENKDMKTPIILFMVVVSVMSVLAIYKAGGGGGRQCVIKS